MIFKQTTKIEKHNLLIDGWIQMVETHPSELLNKHDKNVKKIFKHLSEYILYVTANPNSHSEIWQRFLSF